MRQVGPEGGRRRGEDSLTARDVVEGGRCVVQGRRRGDGYGGDRKGGRRVGGRTERLGQRGGHGVGGVAERGRGTPAGQRSRVQH